MTQIAKHSFALVVALFITAASFDAALTVPVAGQATTSSVPILA